MIAKAPTNPLNPLDIITPIVGVGQGLLNYQSQRETNQSNEQINEQTLDYNKAMTQQQWERDDNAYQRMVADLTKAGLSPLSATHSPLNSGAIASPSMLGMQAPQLDMNQMIDSLLANKEIKENIRHNQKTESYTETDLMNQSIELALKSKSLDIENKQVESQIKYYSAMAENESKRIAEIERNNRENERLRSRDISTSEKQNELRKQEIELERFKKYQDQFYKDLKAQSGGLDIPYKTYKDWNEYQAALSSRNQHLAELINSLKETRSAHGTSSNSSSSLGLNIGGSFAGQGANGGGNGSRTEGSSENEYKDISTKQEQMLQLFYQRNPLPIYVGDNKYGDMF